MRWFKRLLLALLALILLLVIVLTGMVVALNTQAGQHFAVQQINKFGKNHIHLGGLNGRFPSDLTISDLQLMDSKGVWLRADQIELDWSPLALLHRHVAIQALTAQTIAITRSPVFAPAKAKKPSHHGFSIPHLSVKLAKLEINTLYLGSSFTGQAMTLHVNGHALLSNFQNADLAFDASSVPDLGTYHLAGTLTPQNVSLTLAINEKPGGLISHFIAPKGQQPLAIIANLIGPRDNAKLDGALALGAAKLNLTGIVNLDQVEPAANINVIIPDLAPFTPVLGLPVDGNVTLHLTAVKTARKRGVHLSARGLLNITKAPEQLSKLLIGQTTLNILGQIKGNHAQLTELTLNSPAINLSASGTLNKQSINLTAHAVLNQVADLLPHLKGQLDLKTHLSGPLHQLRADAQLGGHIMVPNTPSGPFLLTLRARDLPDTPHGTLIGTGELAGAPLRLSARFAYNPNATSRLKINQATWKSISAQTNLKLKAGVKLPTGRGQLHIANLADLDGFVGQKLSGMVDTTFAYQKNQTLNLSILIKNASLSGLFAGLNAQANADGALHAVAIRLDATTTRLMGSLAAAKLAAQLDVPAQSMSLNHLTASWQDLAAKLRAPAEIEMQPDLAIRHLDLAVAGAKLEVNGTFSPTLNADASAQGFNLSLLKRFAPKLQAAGIVDLTANLRGSLRAPQGHINLKARGLRYLANPATASLPPANLAGSASLNGQSAAVDLTLDAGAQAKATLRGNAPFTMKGPMDLQLASHIAVPLLNPFLASTKIQATGTLLINAHLTGTPQSPAGRITLAAQNIHSNTGIAAAMPTANFNARADLKGQTAWLDMALNAGSDVNMTAKGNVKLAQTHDMDMNVAARFDLKLLDPILAANGNLAHGIVTSSFKLNGPLKSPRLTGDLKLTNGSLLNVTSGLNLTAISAIVSATDKLVTLQSLSATAGHGKITGRGTVELSGPVMPVDLQLNADHATPIASDLLTETLNAALTLQGGLKTGATLAGTVDILKADINIPRSLPPSVANLPIHYVGETPPSHKATPSTIAPIKLDLRLHAKNQIFIRGDGVFAELGGHLGIKGTTTHPEPTGGFSLIRGSLSLSGKTLEFTKGNASFNGDGFMPTLDLEATSATTNGGTATLTVHGMASKPQIGLSSSPSLPSDEILAQLLFAQSSQSLSPFQAASLAAALAQISGVGGGFSPLDSARHVLGLDQLSLGSDGKGSPSVQAGRYVAPGVYVGASQSATGQGSKANIEINLYKGLKLQSATGTDSTGQNSSSVGLSYQFNY